MTAEAAAPKRAYDNRLRERQAEATRERILDALGKEVAEHALTDFSMARVAERAGVSEPTIYRHFGSRDSLFLAYSERFARTSGQPKFPATLGELVARGVGELYRFFESHEPYIRASHTPRLAALFRPGRARRRGSLLKAFASATVGVDPAQARRVQAVFGLLVSSRAYLALKDEHGLGSDDAVAAINWAIRALAQHVKDDAK